VIVISGTTLPTAPHTLQRAGTLKRMGIVDIRDNCAFSVPCTNHGRKPSGVRVASGTPMRLRLIKKFAERIDGVDLSGHDAGDLIELQRTEGRLLLAEGWAVREPDRGRRRYRSATSTVMASAISADGPTLKRRRHRKGSPPGNARG